MVVQTVTDYDINGFFDRFSILVDMCVRLRYNCWSVVLAFHHKHEERFSDVFVRSFQGLDGITAKMILLAEVLDYLMDFTPFTACS